MKEVDINWALDALEQVQEKLEKYHSDDKAKPSSWVDFMVSELEHMARVEEEPDNAN